MASKNSTLFSHVHSDWISTRKELFEACRYGDLDVVQKILASHPDSVGWGFKAQKTPLHVACEKGEEEIAFYLIDKGANLDAQDEDGKTPLHIACTQYEKIAFYLIDKGANLEIRNKDNKTPITVANDSFEREIVSYLISKGAVNPQAMFDACGATYGVEGDLEEVKRILSSHPDSLEWTDEEQKTPLLIACDKEEKEIAFYLIDKGANLDAQDEDGKTPLHLSTLCEEIFFCLIDKGANLEIRDQDGATPLHLAVGLELRELEKPLVDKLLDKGANLNAKNKDNKTPLMVARDENAEEFISYLISKGAVDHQAMFDACRGDLEEVKRILSSHPDSIGWTNQHDFTPLHWALYMENKEIAFYLIDMGANLEAKNKGGFTPLDLAQDLRDEMESYLISKGLNTKEDKSNETQNETPLDVARKENKEEIDKAIFKACMKGDLELVQRILSFHPNSAGWIDNDDRTPLHVACLHDKQNIAFYLIDKGANLEAQDESLETPLFTACYWGRKEIASYLISKGANIGVKNEFKKTPGESFHKNVSSKTEEEIRKLFQKV